MPCERRKERGMPEVQEVFRMATQKVRPDPGALERQHRNQRQRSTRRKAAVYGLVATFVILAAVIVVNALPGNDRNSPPAGNPPASTGLSAPGAYAVDIGTGAPTLLFANPEGAAEYSIAPGGDLLAFQANGGDGNPQIFLMNSDGTGLRQLTLRPGARSPAWSPDGTRIAYRGLAPDSSYEIYVVNVASGKSERVTREQKNVESGYTDQPSWMPDGRAIVYQVGNSPARLHSVVIATGATSTIVEDAGIPDVSPDGSRVAFNTWSTAKVTLADIDGSNRTILLSERDGCCARWSPNGERIAFQSFPGDTLYVYELATGTRRTVASFTGLFDLVDWLDDQTLMISKR
jgi:Tol biopolymer transport system component